MRRVRVCGSDLGMGNLNITIGVVKEKLKKMATLPIPLSFGLIRKKIILAMKNIIDRHTGLITFKIFLGIAATRRILP